MERCGHYVYVNFLLFFMQYFSTKNLLPANSLFIEKWLIFLEYKSSYFNLRNQLFLIHL